MSVEDCVFVYHKKKMHVLYMLYFVNSYKKNHKRELTAWTILRASVNSWAEERGGCPGHSFSILCRARQFNLKVACKKVPLRTLALETDSKSKSSNITMVLDGMN